MVKSLANSSSLKNTRLMVFVRRGDSLAPPSKKHGKYLPYGKYLPSRTKSGCSTTTAFTKLSIKWRHLCSLLHVIVLTVFWLYWPYTVKCNSEQWWRHLMLSLVDAVVVEQPLFVRVGKYLPWFLEGGARLSPAVNKRPSNACFSRSSCSPTTWPFPMTKTHNCRAKIPLSSHIEIKQNKMQEHYLFSTQTLTIFNGAELHILGCMCSWS